MRAVFRMAILTAIFTSVAFAGASASAAGGSSKVNWLNFEAAGGGVFPSGSAKGTSSTVILHWTPILNINEKLDVKFYAGWFPVKKSTSTGLYSVVDYGAYLRLHYLNPIIFDIGAGMQHWFPVPKHNAVSFNGQVEYLLPKPWLTVLDRVFIGGGYVKQTNDGYTDLLLANAGVGLDF